MKVKQTAGRDSLGEFAPEFAKNQRRRIIRRSMVGRRAFAQNPLDAYNNDSCIERTYRQFFSVPFADGKGKRRNQN